MRAWRELGWLLLLGLLAYVSLAAVAVLMFPGWSSWAIGVTASGFAGSFGWTLVLRGWHPSLVLVIAAMAVVGEIWLGVVEGRRTDGAALAAVAVTALASREPRRWLWLAGALALTGVATAAMFATAPLRPDSPGIGVTLDHKTSPRSDPYTVVDVDVTATHCSNPVQVDVWVTFPQTRRRRAASTVTITPDGWEAMPFELAVPDVRDRPGLRRKGRYSVVRGWHDAAGSNAQLRLALRGDWLRRRGVGSCYLRLPELVDYKTKRAYAALGVDWAGYDIRGSIHVFTTLDVSRGPDETDPERSLTHRRCRYLSRDCAYDVVLTERWRAGYDEGMGILVSSLLALLAPALVYAMRSGRRAR